MLFRENIFKREKKENKKIIAQGSGQWLPQGKINGFGHLRFVIRKGHMGKFFGGAGNILLLI